MAQTLKNKIALVTGGAGGSGSAICKKLADEGAQFVITYNSNVEKAENLLNILRGSHHAVYALTTYFRFTTGSIIAVDGSKILN